MSDTLLETLVPAHAPYGPSQAEGYTTCLDYVNANTGLPDFTTEVAAEGTVAHGISDLCLGLGMEPHDFIGVETKLVHWTFEWTEDDADLLAPGLARIRDLDGMFFGEHRVDVSKWTAPGQFGTLDRAVVTPEVYYIDDLKWGRHVPVNPVENKQLVLYALGFWDSVGRHHSDAVDFILSIDQPRCAGGGGVWHTNIDELQSIGAWIKDRVDLGRSTPSPPRTASAKGCMWCRRRRVAGGCDTFDRFATSVAGIDYSGIDMAHALTLPPALNREMTPERRAFIVEHRSMLVKWLEQLEEEHLADTLEGRPAGNLKAVDGKKGRDTWETPAAALDAIVPIVGEKALAPAKLKTPLQLSKVITPEQAKLIEPHIKRGLRKPILVPLDDARPALIPVSDQFDDLPDLATDIE